MTYYVLGIYEVDKASGGSVTRTVTYYPVAGAMRIDNTLYYVLKDHLGSASVVTNASGNIQGTQRYYPFGETRLMTGTIYTDKLYTGQREIAGLGIYHYQARFYSPKIGRFLSADTIVPSYANPQSLNRYSYVLGNPLKYTDPSGHMEDDGLDSGCGLPSCTLPSPVGGTPPVVSTPPPITNPTPSITPPPPLTSLPATPDSTPNPFVSYPPIITTQTPTPLLESYSYPEGSWLDYLDQADLIAGAIGVINDNVNNETDWYTYTSFATDLVGIVVPVAADAVGLGLNAIHANELYIQSLENQSP